MKRHATGEVDIGKQQAEEEKDGKQTDCRTHNGKEKKSGASVYYKGRLTTKGKMALRWEKRKRKGH